jgi:hypothetical protein
VSGDIVERLARDNDFAVFRADDGMPALRLMSEADRRQDAADEIERLRAEIKRLQADLAAERAEVERLRRALGVGGVDRCRW